VNDSNSPYPGPAGNFALDKGVGYLLRLVDHHASYIIVGSDDPGYTVQLKAGAVGVSKTGRNHYAHPYHGVSAFAADLLAELAPDGLQVERFNPSNDSYSPYPGPAGNFPLVPGDSYLVRVVGDHNFIPAHY
jgi:hypothetical protein